MASYICSTCNKSFQRNANLQYHIAKKVCTTGAYEDKTHMCKFCNSYFSSQPGLSRHINHSCKVKKDDDNQKNIIFNKLVKLEEKEQKIKKKCVETKKDKEYKVNKDEKNEQNNIFNMLITLGEITGRLEQEVIELKKTIKTDRKTAKDRKKSIKTKKICTVTYNNVNNGVINNNIILVNYGNEDMAKIDKKEILKALNSGYFSPVSLTETVHFNPKYPEYHNVFISNIKNRYAMMYVDGKWILTLKGDLINQLYEDKKSYIEENFEQFVKSLPESRKKALHKWLEMDDEDPKIIDIKEQLKLLLYNSRDMIDDNVNIASSLLTKKSNKSIKKIKKDIIVNNEKN